MKGDRARQIQFAWVSSVILVFAFDYLISVSNTLCLIFTDKPNRNLSANSEYKGLPQHRLKREWSGKGNVAIGTFPLSGPSSHISSYSGVVRRLQWKHTNVHSMCDSIMVCKLFVKKTPFATLSIYQRRKEDDSEITFSVQFRSLNFPLAFKNLAFEFHRHKNHILCKGRDKNTTTYCKVLYHIKINILISGYCCVCILRLPQAYSGEVKFLALPFSLHIS